MEGNGTDTKCAFSPPLRPAEAAGKATDNACARGKNGEQTATCFRANACSASVR